MNRINNIILSEDIKNRVIFTKLGYYSKKLKYTLSEHPLFGQDKCVHDINLYLQWHNYSRIYNHIKDKKTLNVIEIGAGAGILTMLLYHDLSAKITIVDLPEMISLSSACVNMLLPKAKMLLPNEVTGKIDYEKYDFVFLLPNQSHKIQENHYDLAVNSNSMCEMKKEEIDFYFQLIQRVVRNGGLFYCSNRYRENPFAMNVGDNETREFFRYPWNKHNLDILTEVNRFKYEFTNKSFDHLHIDRLQKIVKEIYYDNREK